MKAIRSAKCALSWLTFLVTTPAAWCADPAPYARIEGIAVESAVPADQYSRVKEDLAAFRAFRFSTIDPTLLPMMGVSNAAIPTLLSWLRERVHFLVSENFTLSPQTISIVEQNYPYPEPGILPTVDTPVNNPNIPVSGPVGAGSGDLSPPIGLASPSPNPQIVMLNIGGALYIVGKQQGPLLALTLDGVGAVTLTSPRAGVLQVGQGLFFQGIQGESGLTQDSMAYVGYRLGVLFHEARHSDGNGKTAAFLHAVCPTGHDYSGYAACDNNLNGPYEIQARFLSSMRLSCSSCTEQEKEILSLLALDSEDRFLAETPDPNFDPKARLSAVDSEIRACEGMPVPCSNLALLKTEAASLAAGTFKPPMVRSTDWDPAPEGSFAPSAGNWPLWTPATVF